MSSCKGKPTLAAGCGCDCAAADVSDELLLPRLCDNKALNADRFVFDDCGVGGAAAAATATADTTGDDDETTLLLLLLLKAGAMAPLGLKLMLPLLLPLDAGDTAAALLLLLLLLSLLLLLEADDSSTSFSSSSC